jgi:murein DD-endopeptidase MepM/ murein hydrolase activator NlpD
VVSHKDEFGASALTSSATSGAPLTRREAKALWEAEQKAAAKAAKRAKKTEHDLPVAATVAAPVVAAVVPAVDASVVEAPAAEPETIEAVEAEPAVVEPITIAAAVAAEAAAEAATEVAAQVELTPRQSPTPKVKKVAPKLIAVAKAKSAKPAKPYVSNRRRTARVTTMVAMAFAAGLAVATTVPANALLTASDVRARNLGVVTDYGDGQAVQAGDGSAASGRDKVSALQWGGAMGGIHSGFSFVNNPMGAVQYPIRESVPMSDMYGWRSNPFGSGSEFHHGIDFDAGAGHPIQAIADGVVTIASNGDGGGYSALGYYVTIEHVINGHKITSLYAHMIAGSIQVKVGQRVRVGDIVGLVGSTGASTGAHLHFQILVDGVESDPWAWLQANVK